MQLNRSTDYAIQMLVYLAKARKTVSSSKLAAAIGVSYRYLLQISAKLRAAGFIRAAHGPSGGLALLASVCGNDELCHDETVLCAGKGRTDGRTGRRHQEKGTVIQYAAGIGEAGNAGEYYY